MRAEQVDGTVDDAITFKLRHAALAIELSPRGGCVNPILKKQHPRHHAPILNHVVQI